MSNFNFNCPEPITGNTPSTHECGVEKVFTWTNEGLHNSSSNSFYLVYSKLTNLRPIYVIIKPTVQKLLKFNFTPVTTNGANITVYIKQKKNGIDTVISEIPLGVLSSTYSKYLQVYLDDENKSDVIFTIEFRTTGGSSGSFKIQLDCDPEVISGEFCTGYNSATYCDECPQTITLYTEKVPGWSVAPFTNSPYYLDDNLSVELTNGDIYVPKVNFIGSETGAGANNRIILTYNTSTHRFVITSCGGGAGVQGCGTQQSTSLTTSSAKYTHPYFPDAFNYPDIMKGISKDSGLKYAYWDFVFSLNSPHREVPITITSSGNNRGVTYVIGDGIDLNKIGNISESLSYVNTKGNGDTSYRKLNYTTIYKYNPNGSTHNVVTNS